MAAETDTTTATGGLRCARHPNQETNLRCSRCETPVCTRCMVYTSVGIRCPDCARPKRSGVYAPSAAHVGRAAAAGGGVALAIGLLWGLFPAYAFWLALLLGFGGGELVNLASGGKRGPELRAVAAGMVILAFLLGVVLGGAAVGGSVIFHTVVGALALYLAVSRQG